MLNVYFCLNFQRNIEFPDGISGYKLQVPANKRVAVNFWIEPVKVGEAHIQVGAVDSENKSDGFKNVIPVRNGTLIRT